MIPPFASVNPPPWRTAIQSISPMARFCCSAPKKGLVCSPQMMAHLYSSPLSVLAVPSEKQTCLATKSPSVYPPPSLLQVKQSAWRQGSVASVSLSEHDSGGGLQISPQRVSLFGLVVLELQKSSSPTQHPGSKISPTLQLVSLSIHTLGLQAMKVSFDGSCILKDARTVLGCDQRAWEIIDTRLVGQLDGGSHT